MTFRGNPRVRFKAQIRPYAPISGSLRETASGQVELGLTTNVENMRTLCYLRTYARLSGCVSPAKYSRQRLFLLLSS